MIALAMVCAVAAGWTMFQSADAGGDKRGPTPVVRNHYELRSLPYADTFVLLRFEKYSGRVWRFNALRWDDIEETTAVPPGEYDVLLVPIGNPINPLGVAVTAKDYRTYRIEKETGRTWMIQANKWAEMKDR